MPKKQKYKLSARDLDVQTDLRFVDGVLKDLRLQASPKVRGVLIDLVYTMARDKLEEAHRFAKLANRRNLTVEDLKMAHLEPTEELRRGPNSKRLQTLLPTQASLPMPGLNAGLMLPTWRHCQVGMKAHLRTSKDQDRMLKRKLMMPMAAPGPRFGPRIGYAPTTQQYISKPLLGVAHHQSHIPVRGAPRRNPNQQALAATRSSYPRLINPLAFASANPAINFAAALQGSSAPAYKKARMRALNPLALQKIKIEKID